MSAADDDLQPAPTELLRTAEAAALLGLSPATLRAWRRRRVHLAYTRVGKRCMYRRADLQDLLARGRVEPEGGP